MPAENELRKFRRYSLRRYAVEYTKVNLFSFLGKTSGARHPLINLSESGLQFLASKEPAVGDTISLTIRTPFMVEFITAKATVKWVRPIEKKNFFRVGAEFTAIDEEASAQISSLRTDLDETAIKVFCAKCGTQLSIQKKYVGKKGRCPKCGGAVVIVDEAPENELVTEANKLLGVRERDDAKEVKKIGTQRRMVISLKNALAATDKTTQDTVKYYIKSRLHLTMLEHTITRGLRITTFREMQTFLEEDRDKIEGAFRDFVRHGIYKEVGTDTFNFAPPPKVKTRIYKLFNQCRNPKTRMMLLALIMANEKGQL